MTLAGDDAESGAHFTRRIESFADLVFGFSLSLLAGRLVVPAHESDIFGHPAGLIGFLTTFAVIVDLWFLNHRTFRNFYTPLPLDTILVFAQLAAVALMPYALEVTNRFSFASSTPIVLYDGVFFVIAFAHAVVAFRGFRRRFRTWEDRKRRERWRFVLVMAVLACSFAIGAACASVDARAGTFAFWATVPIVVAIRFGYRGLPRFARDGKASALL